MRKMFLIGILASLQLWGLATGLQNTEKVPEYTSSVDLYSVFVTALRDLKACKSLTLCELVERFKVPLQSFTRYSSDNTERRRENYRDDINPRSYYSSYGAPAAPAPTYVPAFLGFDPLSILASLAFLAFLLQSVASLFDRSRSIIPTIVSSRQTPEASIQDIADRIYRAIDRHELYKEEQSSDNEDNKV